MSSNKHFPCPVLTKMLSAGLFAFACLTADAENGLWRLAFRAGTAGREVVLDPRGAVAEEQSAGGRRLVWRGLDLEKGDGAVDVVCTIERNAAFGWDEYRIAVTNRSSKYGLFETEYPRLYALATPGKGAVVRPAGCWGGQRVREKVRGRAPFPDWSSPFQLAFFERDEGGGTLVAALDPEGRIKYLNYTDSFDFSFSVPAVDAGVPGKSGAPDFAVAVSTADADWLSAAKRYRRWATANARWMRKGPLVARSDRSAAFRDIGLWFLFQHPHDIPLKRTEEEIEKALKIVDGRFPIAAHIYCWHRHPQDVFLPEYFPARDGFREMVARLSEKGVRIMPYLNGRIWDHENARFGEVRDTMCRQADGSLFTEKWHGHEFSAVCPSAPHWKTWLADLGVTMTRDFGAGALYYDQIASMTAVPCYAADHGHPVGGGTHWTAGYRTIVEGIRAAVPDVPLTSENWSEPYTDLFDGFLVWGPNVGNDVPLTPAVYSGYMSPFACRVGEETSDPAFYALQARSFLWGAQTGWERPWILADKYRHRLEYLIKLALLRRTALDFFADGEFLGPVENRIKDEPLKVKVYRWGRELDAEFAPVMAAKWRNPSGRTMMAVANVTGEERRFEGDGIAWNLAPFEIRLERQER